MIKYRTHDEYLIECFKADPSEAVGFLNVCIEDEDPRIFLKALSLVAKAHGFTKLSKKSEISRMGLYKTVSKNGNPEFKTLLAILKATGIRLSFRAT